MVIVSKYLVPKGYLAITIWPFIFVRNKGLKDVDSLISHEKIHLKQQLELLILLFYIWYGIEYLVHYIKYKDHLKAYRSISFEVEANTYENDLDYLNTRKLFSWFKYL
jgi:hypothetical protein